MKRRTEAAGKLRRTIKKNNGLNGNGSTTFFFYLKIILIWASVIFCDYMSELRVEYLWPFWLLLRSVYDSYKYKGLAFSFLFICICITSDLICLFLIPIQWIFFVASTYVMVQFVWIHTDKICLPTIILWLIFIWMEAKIRWKDNRNIPHLDLCRPFAAHCIGYPVVTLGFGFKSYIGYRIRQRKQKEVSKENEFYMQLLQQALPQDEVEKSEEQADSTDISNISTNTGNSTNNNVAASCKNTQNHHNNHQNHHNHSHSSSKVNSNGSINNSHCEMNGSVNNSKQQNVRKNTEKENGCIQNLDNNHQHNQESIPNNSILSNNKNNSKAANHLNFNNLQSVKNTNTTSYQQIQNGITKELNVPAKCSPYKNKDDHNTYIASNNKKEYEKEKIIKDTNYDETNTTSSNEIPPSQKRKDKQQQQKDNQQYHQQHQQNASNNNHNNNSSTSNCNNQLNNEKNKVCEHCQRLEQESKRLKSELQSIKSLEQEVRQKYENVKGCLQTKQKETEDLQKQYLDVQAQERRTRQHFEAQLNQEKRLRKHAEEKANMIRCPESCKMKKMHLESENNKLRREYMLLDEVKNNYEKQNRLYEQELRKYEIEFRNRDQNQNVALQNALVIMQEKNATLEKNLSAETRIKLDLFSALGEARRQIEIRDNCLRNKDKQLEELEAKTVQILAIMPSINDTHFQLNSLNMTASSSSMEQPDSFAKNPQLNAG
ncbi:macoilin [Chironomus tepperi]|uniref:macoilin n=1 Tax=Chironomus tepperi TaxID=113505 RepID=UPI00391F6288